ncbi:MAG: CPBP family intramembrane metalloprotease [Clostridia bacterium]|nr:CPBP family intramembrane metalloprotease [Clostridia bacterium]
MNAGFKANLFTPVLVLVVLALIFAANFLPEDALGMDENPYLAVVVIELLTYAVPSLFYCMIRDRAFVPKLRLRLFAPSQILYLFYAAVFMLTGVVLVSVLMYNAYPDAFAASSVTEYAAFAMNERFFDTIYLIVAFAVLPAVTEEFLFRGIVIGEYERYGASVAAFMSAVMFAMSHFSLVRFPVYLFSGLVLASVLFATRSVIAAILIHALNNTVVLLCEKYVLHIVDKQNVSLVLFMILIGGACVLSAMLMCYEAQSIYHGYAEKNLPSEYASAGRKNIFSRIAQAFFTPTFLLLVILFTAAAMAEF